MATRLIPLALLFVLFAATPTAAAIETPLGDLSVLALEEEELEAEAAAEEVEEECEEVEEGFEECEEVESEDERAGASSREACLLRTARAHAALDRQGKKLKLTIGYTTYEPAKATIEVGKGASHVATLHRHLGHSGVLRVVKPLRKNQHLKRLVVRIQIPSVKRAGCPSRQLVLFPH